MYEYAVHYAHEYLAYTRSLSGDKRTPEFAFSERGALPDMVQRGFCCVHEGAHERTVGRVEWDAAP